MAHDDEFQIAKKMIIEAVAISKTRSTQEYINALTAIEDYCKTHNMSDLAKATNKKIKALRKNMK